MKKLYLITLLVCICSVLSAQNVGIGTDSPLSKFSIEGNLSVGIGYADVTAAPTNGAIIQGTVGIGTDDPQHILDVRGIVSAEQLRLYGAIGTSTGAADNYILQLENHGTTSGTPAGYNVTKSRFGGKYADKNLPELSTIVTTGSSHYLTNAELFSGNAQDNVVLHNGNNTNGNFQSLYDGVSNSAGASFHYFRGGCSGSDWWGFTYTFDNIVSINRFTSNVRPDCCQARMGNMRIELLDASDNILYTIGTTSGGSNFDNSFSEVIAYKIRFRILNCGNTAFGDGIINFGEFGLYGFNTTTTTIQSAGTYNYPTFSDPVILNNVPTSNGENSEQLLVVDNEGVVRASNGQIDAIEGLNTKRRYYYFARSHTANGSSYNDVLGGWDFCASAGGTFNIGDDVFDGGSDGTRVSRECTVYIDSEGSNVQVQVDYTYTSKPTWRLYSRTATSYDTGIGQVCRAVCVNFDY